MRVPVPAPDPLPAPAIDSHTHLDVRRSDAPDGLGLDDALALARSVNVAEVVQVGCDLEAARRAVEWAAENPSVHAAVSLHPTDAADLGRDDPDALDDAVAEIDRLAAMRDVVAVGESGLDYYWTTDRAGRRAQEQSFRAHIRLARTHDRALVIHDRDAHDDVLRVLEDEGPPSRVVFHCFSGSAAMAAYCVQSGWYVSFAGPLTFRNNHALRDAARAAMEVDGLSHVLVETDAPYLTPHPHRGRVNSSYLLPWTLRAVADVASLDVASVCEATRTATERAFALR